MPDGTTVEEPPGLEAVDVDDLFWRRVDLPHDWAIEGPFRPDIPARTGRLPHAGIGWYRKAITLDARDEGKRVYLDFDGAMKEPRVYVNGHFVGEWAYGYNSFRVDASDRVVFGSANLVAVRLSQDRDCSRWYPGAGLYRAVHIEVVPRRHIAHWGVHVRTPAIGRDKASVEVETTVENHEEEPSTVFVEQHVLSPTGDSVASSAVDALDVVPSGSEGDSDVGRRLVQTLSVATPAIWDVEHPHLYTLRTVLTSDDGVALHSVDTPFGFRTFGWDADRGFVLNGRRLRLNGVCLHHDHGPLGGAFYRRAMERQLEIMKEMGANAVRTAHNPPAPEMVDLCDRMGLLVIDELFDGLKHSKTADDYGVFYDDWYKRDVRNFVLRDRNHPSVILWSIGNEVVEQHDPSRHGVLADLVAEFRHHDADRPIYCSLNDHAAAETGYARMFDVIGIHYPTDKEYERAREVYPSHPILGTENGSTVSSRGEYFFPLKEGLENGAVDGHVSSYDLFGPPWATSPDAEFRNQDRFPWIAGEFVWTGFDYLGEPTPYNRDETNALNFRDDDPWKDEAIAMLDAIGGAARARSSYFGIVDLCGFRKDRFFLYQSRWRPDHPMVHILPHWSWPERVGEVTPVHVYTSGDEAELFLNGTSLGRKRKGPAEYRLRWDDTVYEPGHLRVVAYKNGAYWAEETVSTAGEATSLRMTPDRIGVKANGIDLAYITVDVIDAEGRIVPRAKTPVVFDIAGPAVLAGVGSGDPTSFESFRRSRRTAFNGKCLLILRTTGLRGVITAEAHADGLTSAGVALASE